VTRRNKLKRIRGNLRRTGVPVKDSLLAPPHPVLVPSIERASLLTAIWSTARPQELTRDLQVCDASAMAELAPSFDPSRRSISSCVRPGQTVCKTTIRAVWRVRARATSPARRRQPLAKNQKPATLTGRDSQRLRTVVRGGSTAACDKSTRVQSETISLNAASPQIPVSIARHFVPLNATRADLWIGSACSPAARLAPTSISSPLCVCARVRLVPPKPIVLPNPPSRARSDTMLLSTSALSATAVQLCRRAFRSTCNRNMSTVHAPRSFEEQSHRPRPARTTILLGPRIPILTIPIHETRER